VLSEMIRTDLRSKNTPVQIKVAKMDSVSIEEVSQD